MRLFLCLVSSLITILNAQNAQLNVTGYHMPNGFPNGAILTFFFWHEGDSSETESVDINLYDLPKVEIDEMYDITAHLSIERNSKTPVVSNTFKNGKWLEHIAKEQPLDENPPHNGWWRVDVIKLDNERLNVFFQGFWSDVRSFNKSLDNVVSIYVSKHVDRNRIKILLKVPNGNIAPLSFDRFKSILYPTVTEDITLISFPYFPVGSHMEMTAVLAASGGERNRKPSLVFKAQDSDVIFMKIYQKWEDDTQWLYVHSNDKGILCTNEKPNGDLQHMRLKRISQDKVSLQVFYKPSTGVDGVMCEHTLPADLAGQFDKPFEIKSWDSAMLLHIEHSVPRTNGEQEKKKD